MRKTDFPQYDAFYSKLRSCSPLEAKDKDQANLSKCGLTTEQAVVKFKLSKPPLIELRIINTSNKHGSRDRWDLSKIFWAALTMKMLCQLQKQCKNWLLFTTARISICWSLVVLYQTWPTFAYTILLMQISIHSRKEIKTCWRKLEKMLLVVPLSFLHPKQLLMKLFLESLQTYVKQLLGLMLLKYIHSRCINLCRPVFIRVEISVQRRLDLRQDKTRPAGLKKWSCPIFNEQDQNVKLKASLQQAARRKLTAFVLMGFVLIATLGSNPLFALTTSLPVKKYESLSLKRIFNAVASGEGSMLWDDTIYRRKAPKLWKCKSAKGGDCTN